MEAIFAPDLVLQETAGQKILQMDRLVGFRKNVVDHESIVDGVVKQLPDAREGESIRTRYRRLVNLVAQRVGESIPRR